MFRSAVPLVSGHSVCGKTTQRVHTLTPRNIRQVTIAPKPASLWKLKSKYIEVPLSQALHIATHERDHVL